jgi:K+-transporting ATPase ATPase A chain
MSARYYILLIVFFALVALIAWPLGRYMARVFAGTNGFSRKLGGPIERVLYRLAGVDPNREQTWKSYAMAVLGFSLLTQLVTYVMLRMQDSPPFPRGWRSIPPSALRPIPIGSRTAARRR